MKAVILAGGLGTRLSEETQIRPKPMVEIGGKPILWHIMKLYSFFGINDFIICCGYKGYMIKEYFANYSLHMSDVTFNMQSNRTVVHQNYAEPWQVTLVDTGDTTMTGGRLKRVQSFIGDETFCFTYGDGLSDINIRELIEFHRQQGTHATVTAIQPLGRFGALSIEGNKVVDFAEKPRGDDTWINGGFFVLEPAVFRLIKGDETTWEYEPLESLARESQLAAYKYTGFWRPMDTLRDKIYLEELWQKGKAPWKIWDQGD
ncbi:nucleotidyl transferase [Lucifera butyrica]|uniref:Nucleotidyl transferase n=1 Tax=Lucifera butyrica TaxID=1351585 RepID=A0A498QYC8_9FIRM|nr:glucose-1-phosphate cytidylyltransferase [Lucifera butyrica]VBB05186.1 nucleotidyl transferase [Lucifera butyrica]